MDISTLTRDAGYVKSKLSVADNQVFAKTQTQVLFPVIFEEKKIAQIGTIVRTIGFICFVIDNKYSVMKVCADVTLEPTSLTKVVIGSMEYYQLTFDAGSRILTSLDLLKNKSILYYIFDTLIAKGNIPWYLDYEDMAKLFTTADKHAGVNLGVQNTIHEMIAATISRQAKDRTQYVRFALLKPEDYDQVKISFEPFRSVVYGATNTTSRLLGSYFDDNTLSALVNPSQSTEKVEELLRK